MSLLLPILTGASTFVGVGLVYTGHRALQPRRHNLKLFDSGEQLLDAAALTEQPIHPALIEEHDAVLNVGGIDCRVHYAHQRSLHPNAPVLLLLHGHSSSLREFDDLYPHLAPHFEVFAFDQPNNGLSSDVPVSDVLKVYRGAHRGFEALRFLREVIDAFVRQVTPGRPTVVAGGSLGGNLSLFIAESRPRPSWLDRVVVWSPASAWKHTWEKPIGAAVAHYRARKIWGREEFLKAVFCEPIMPFTPPQPVYWYWDCWGHEAKDWNRQGAGSCNLCDTRPSLDFDSKIYPRMGRRKVEAIERGFGALKRWFTPNRASWHWEIAAEEIAWSHFSREGDGPAYSHIGCDVDFVAGTEDRYALADLFGATRELFRATSARLRQSGLKIRGRWLEQTGHSVHHERPTALTKILAGLL